MAKMMEVPEWTDKVDVRKRPCERIPVNSPTVKKTMLWSGLKNSRSFFTVYNNYRNLSSFFSYLRKQSVCDVRYHTVADLKAVYLLDSIAYLTSRHIENIFRSMREMSF